MAAGDDPNERWIERIEADQNRLWEKIGKLERFQAWATGLAVGAAGALGLFADYIKKHIGL